MKKTIVVYALDRDAAIIHLEVFPLPNDDGDRDSVDKAVMKSFAFANDLEDAHTVFISAIEKLTIKRLYD